MGPESNLPAATSSPISASAEEAQNLKVRADLMIELAKLIEARGFTQPAAAKLLGVTQPRISDSSARSTASASTA